MHRRPFKPIEISKECDITLKKIVGFLISLLYSTSYPVRTLHIFMLAALEVWTIIIILQCTTNVYDEYVWIIALDAHERIQYPHIIYSMNSYVKMSTEHWTGHRDVHAYMKNPFKLTQWITTLLFRNTIFFFLHYFWFVRLPNPISSSQPRSLHRLFTAMSEYWIPFWIYTFLVEMRRW